MAGKIDGEVDDVFSAAREFVIRLNEDSKLGAVVQGWCRILIFHLKTSADSNDAVYIRAGPKNLNIVDELPSHAQTVEITARPGDLISICRGSISLSEALTDGRVEIVRGSLPDLLRMKAILDRLETVLSVETEL